MAVFQVSGDIDAVDEAGKGLASLWMLQLLDCLAFDLSNAFAGDLENLPYFFEGVRITVSQPVSELEDLSFAIVEGLHRFLDLLFERLLVGFVQGIIVAVVFEKLAEEAIVVVAYGLI